MQTPGHRTPLPAPRHRGRFGWPLPALAGAAGDVDATDPEAQGSGTPEPDAPPPLPFSIDEIEDEAQRQYLRGREAQMQAGFTKAIQGYRSKVGHLLELDGALSGEDEAARTAALNKLLEPYGYELPGDDDDAAPLDDTPDPEDPLDRRLAELEAFRDETVTSRQQEAQDAREREFLLAAQRGLEDIASELGLEGGYAALPEHVRDAVMSRALAMPRNDAGHLDLEAAWDAHKGYEATIREEERTRYRASKDVPAIDPTGGEADPKVNLGDAKTRRERAVAVAGRHL